MKAEEFKRELTESLSRTFNKEGFIAACVDALLNTVKTAYEQGIKDTINKMPIYYVEFHKSVVSFEESESYDRYSDAYNFVKKKHTSMKRIKYEHLDINSLYVVIIEQIGQTKTGLAYYQ